MSVWFGDQQEGWQGCQPSRLDFDSRYSPARVSDLLLVLEHVDVVVLSWWIPLFLAAQPALPLVLDRAFYDCSQGRAAGMTNRASRVN